MGREPRRLARMLGSAAAIAVAGYSMVMFGSGAPAFAGGSGCQTPTPPADVLVTQSSAPGTVSGGSIFSVTVTATIENEGPCNASGVGFMDTFGGVGGTALAATIVTTNPSNEPCVAAGATVTCTALSKMSAPSDANTKNPGTVVITMSVSPLAVPAGSVPFSDTAPPLTSVAQVTYAGDQTNGNNQSQGGFIFDGGDLLYSNPGDPQTTDISVATGFRGGGEIYQKVTAPPCPSGVKCFGENVQINSDDIVDASNNPALQVLTFVVPIPKNGPQSASQVVVLYVPDGQTQWVPVKPCTSPSTPTPNPCVVSITKVKLASGIYVFDIVVATTHTSRWGF